MRVVIRFLIGLILFAAGVGAAGYGVMTLTQTIEAKKEQGPRRGGPSSKERVFSVNVAAIELQEARPEIQAFGEIRSWRTLELRASLAGYVVELTDSFRDGAEVAKGDLLFRIDPKDYAAREADARIAVAEAEADLSEAEQGLLVAEREIAAAELSRDLRDAALSRQRDLKSRGVSTESQVEEAEMALASAEQTAASRAQAMLSAQIRIDRNRLKLERAMNTLSEASRELAETEHRAPFAGLLSEVSGVLGGLAAPNENMGRLIDPTALEAAFRVTNAQFARLLDERGALRPTPLTVTLDLDDVPLTITGFVDRADAIVGFGQSGRQVFAKLDLDGASLLRPGDFVSVRIVEPPLQNVAVVPASAVTEDGELLRLGADDRLEAVQVRILRRQRDSVIVSGAEPGWRYVTERSPQLGAGIKVRPLENTPDGAPPAPAVPEMVELEPALQERMITFVQDNKRMPDDVKARVLKRLRSGKAPQTMVDRITQRMGG
ncbi:MAG: biotin/lipoyl-binding protein [Pseudomonadota bacterium]